MPKILTPYQCESQIEDNDVKVLPSYPMHEGSIYSGAILN